jgi:hypothetical protein
MVQLQSSIWGSFPGFYELFKELPFTLKLKAKVQKGAYSLRKINKELIKLTQKCNDDSRGLNEA